MITSLGVGDTFTGVTHCHRVIPNGKVVAIDDYFNMSRKVCWYDENGKHYEWFGDGEFKEFNIINQEEAV